MIALTAPDITDTSDFGVCFKAFTPRPAVRLLPWCKQNISNDQGRPYDHASYPHLVAPGGPMDAYDDPRIRTIIEQFGTRLGKTFFAQCAQIHAADTNPCPQLFASSDERSCKRVLWRTYQMIYQNGRIKNQLLKHSEKDHKQDAIIFRRSSITGAWARSPSTLADMNIKVGHANEIDKWEHQTTSKEAHPLKLFSDRHKDYQSVRKCVYEGTPTIKGKSPIERLLLSGTNCRYHVPCPHCKQYQFLKFGDGEAGGIVFERPEGGALNKAMAKRTAKYQCAHCQESIDNHWRSWMMRRGVWCPEGCEVNHEKALDITERSIILDEPCWEWSGWENAEWVKGTPARNGEDASYHLSSIYALALDWGDIAAEFCDTKGKPALFRNFINQWLADTWEIIERKQTWEQLGERIIFDEYERFVVPPFASMLTLGIDRQKDFYVWVVDAWGPDRTHCTIAYGDSDDLGWIQEHLINRSFEHADGGEALKPMLTLIDDGFRPDNDVLEFCKACLQGGFNVLPCRGSTKALSSDYTRNRLGESSSMPGMVFFYVDTIRSQCWIDKVLHKLEQGDPGCAYLHKGSIQEHQDFLEQLLNDAAILDVDSKNNLRENYERVDVDIPNDYRDCRRYSYTAMLIATRGAPIRARAAKPVKRSAVISSGIGRRDGRNWV